MLAIRDLVRRGRLRDSDLADREVVRDAFVGFARWAHTSGLRAKKAVPMLNYGDRRAKF
jgi:hypothetical protein